MAEKALLGAGFLLVAAGSAYGSIKAVLDTPLLTEDGNLTEESETVALQIDGAFQRDRQLELS